MENIEHSDEIAAIEGLTREYIAAIERKDIARLIDLNSDDVVYLPPGQAPIVGKTAVRQMFEMFFAQFSSIEQSAATSEIKVFGDRALAWGPEAMKLTTHSGQVIELTGHGMTLMARQEDGSWKFVRGINNLTLVRP